MRERAVAVVAGFVFALGLGVSGMTDPRKVIAFLDVTGAWDPSLALVMVGAIGVHFLAARWASLRVRPLLAPSFVLPADAGIDLRLLAGAALFGVGWGAAGFCPGPAIVALAGFSMPALAFFTAMVVGIAAFRWLPPLQASSGGCTAAEATGTDG